MCNLITVHSTVSVVTMIVDRWPWNWGFQSIQNTFWCPTTIIFNGYQQLLWGEVTKVTSWPPAFNYFQSYARKPLHLTILHIFMATLLPQTPKNLYSDKHGQHLGHLFLWCFITRCFCSTMVKWEREWKWSKDKVWHILYVSHHTLHLRTGVKHKVNILSQ